MSKSRRTSQAVKHNDRLATMTTPEGIRIVISTASLQSTAQSGAAHVEPKDTSRGMRYYLHRNGLTAKTRDANEGLVYETFGCRPVTKRQYLAAQAKREREVEQYERDALKLIAKYEAAPSKGKRSKRKPQPTAIHIEPKDDRRTPEQIKAELERRISKKKRGAGVGVPKRRKAGEMDGREVARHF